MKEKIAKFFATSAGVGYIPVGPGTFGSMVALIWVGFFFGQSTFTQILSAVLCFVLGVWASNEVIKSTGHPDPPFVVIDEVCGIFVTFLFIPVTPTTLALGFIFFRILDIFKLPFIRRLEAWPNGYGIILDDLAAGILSNLLLHAWLMISSK